MEPLPQFKKPRQPRPKKCKSQMPWILNTVSGVLGALALGVIATSADLRHALPDWQLTILLVICNAIINWRMSQKKIEEDKK